MEKIQRSHAPKLIVSFCRRSGGYIAKETRATDDSTLESLCYTWFVCCSSSFTENDQSKPMQSKILMVGSMKGSQRCINRTRVIFGACNKLVVDKM